MFWHSLGTPRIPVQSCGCHLRCLIWRLHHSSDVVSREKDEQRFQGELLGKKRRPAPCLHPMLVTCDLRIMNLPLICASSCLLFHILLPAGSRRDTQAGPSNWPPPHLAAIWYRKPCNGVQNTPESHAGKLLLIFTLNRKRPEGETHFRKQQELANLDSRNCTAIGFGLAAVDASPIAVFDCTYKP